MIIKKDQYIFTLSSLYTQLKGESDIDVREAIDFLLSKVSALDSDSSLEDKEAMPANFKIPSELETVDSGFAIFSDGGCRGNPGPGAWATICQNKRAEILFELCSAEELTTNNKMELMAAIQGFNRLKDIFISDKLSERQAVFIYSDSRYLVDGLNSWIEGWKKRGWKKADNKEPENIELWKILDEFKSFFKNLKIIWVRGHAGHPQNEYCDSLVNKVLDAR